MQGPAPISRRRPWPARAGLSAVATATLVWSAAAAAQGAPAPSRGELLYSTHCVACHSTQKHWRAKRVVRDWDGLMDQVRIWQDAQQLIWSDADIAEVARFLNDSIYRLPQTGGVRQGRGPGAARDQASVAGSRLPPHRTSTTRS